jgi:hypothetical protein
MGVRCFLVEKINIETWVNDNGRTETLFDVRRTDTGEVIQSRRQWLSGLPEGAMYWEEMGALPNPPTGPPHSPTFLFTSGPHLHVICPGFGQWNIDSRASNCTMPYDYEHRCWIRHGEPPVITVDKNGLTCEAGAGSIQCGKYHGFLRDGEFT